MHRALRDTRRGWRYGSIVVCEEANGRGSREKLKREEREREIHRERATAFAADNDDSFPFTSSTLPRHYTCYPLGPILVQSQCEVLSNDTGATLKDRVQTLEKVALVDAVRRHCGRSHGRMEGEEKVGDYAITYKDAGVDITAGNELIDKIKPHCKSTRRPGCDADLGGFGGMFDLAAAGFSRGDGAGNPDDTVLVACTDGVGTKLKIAQMAGKHDTVGIDLVAMSVNDLIVQVRTHERW